MASGGQRLALGPQGRRAPAQRQPRCSAASAAPTAPPFCPIGGLACQPQAQRQAWPERLPPAAQV
eukprot:309544-Alexandrium_andersonii.AAC.1